MRNASGGPQIAFLIEVAAEALEGAIAIRAARSRAPAKVRLPSGMCAPHGADRQADQTPDREDPQRDQQSQEARRGTAAAVGPGGRGRSGITGALTFRPLPPVARR